MSTIGGQFAAVNGHVGVRQWSIDEITEPARYRASHFRNGTQRVAGIKDFTGSFTQELPHPASTVMPGELFQFQGYTGPGTSVYGANGRVYDSGASGAIVDQVTITWSWSPGEPSIQTVVNFSNASSTGLTDSSTTAIADAGTEILPTICDLQIKTGTGVGTVWTNWTQAVLTISANNPSTVNASTSCWRIRKPGPIDWTLSVTEDDDEQKLTIGTDYRILLYTSATEYWELLWGHLEGYTGLNVDIDSGAIISKTANFGMVSHNGTTLGSITLPGAGAAWWPPT